MNPSDSGNRGSRSSRRASLPAHLRRIGRCAGLLAALTVLVEGAGAVPAARPDPGIRHLRPNAVPTVPTRLVRALAAQQAPGALVGRAQAAPRPGTVRTWISYDDAREGYYRQSFSLAAVGRAAEIWVSQDISFPPGDCRNASHGGSRIRVSAAQAAAMARAFDRNVYPRESAAFSVPPRRDGSRARIRDGTPQFAGDGRRLVVLVENIRDDNYYDRNGARNLSYVAGFFLPGLLELFDRNVVVIDGYDWNHRTGRTPPHEPVPGDLCTSAPGRPFLYEGVLAHEYQHLLEHYEDRDEETFVNEGLSNHAQTLTGYVRPSRSIHTSGYDVQVQCFLGGLGVQTLFNAHPRASGPSHSLTDWRDPASDRLCQYGAAYTFAEFLAGRYGRRFMKELHRENASGLSGIGRTLARLRIRTTPARLIREWAASMALDGVLDRGVALRGAPRGRYRVPTLSATIIWESALAHSRLGVPVNGSHYVRLRRADGTFVPARELQSIAFQSAGDEGATRGGALVVQLVGYSSAGRRAAAIAVVSGRRWTLSRQRLRALLGDAHDVVAAVVTFTAPTSAAARRARYTLAVNGVVQPGG